MTNVLLLTVAPLDVTVANLFETFLGERSYTLACILSWCVYKIDYGLLVHYVQYTGCHSKCSYFQTRTFRTFHNLNKLFGSQCCVSWVLIWFWMVAGWYKIGIRLDVLVISMILLKWYIFIYIVRIINSE